VQKVLEKQVLEKQVLEKPYRVGTGFGPR